MKMLNKIALIIVLVIFSASGMAAQYNATGKITHLATTHIPNFPIQGIILKIENFNSAGSCIATGSAEPGNPQLVLIKLQDGPVGDAQLSIALSAYVTGQDVQISVDDSITGSGGLPLCTLLAIGLSSSL